MDANGLNFRMLSTAADWLPPAGSNTLYYCSVNSRLQLRSSRMGGPWKEDFATAQALVETAPMARDMFGNYARWDAAGKNVVAGGAGAGEVTIYTPSAGQSVTDLAMGTDGVLYIAVSGTLVLVDRRNRWPNATLADADFAFWRLAALPEGGVMALDRTTPQLGKVSGLPLQVEPGDTPDPGILRSCQANGNPPRIVKRIALPSGETPVAFCAMSPGTFAVISWASNTAANTAALLRLWSQATGLTTPWTFSETVFPYALAWLDAQRLAVFATSLKEALIYDLQGSPANLAAAGDTYVLKETNPGPFVHGFDTPPWYSGGDPLMYPLVPLSLNSLAGVGTTMGGVPGIIDSGSSQTVWHRMFLEAILPPRCGILVWLASSNNIADFTGGTGAAPLNWYPHAFGAVPAAPQVTSKASSATASSLIDITQSWTPNQWRNYAVTITGGTGAGQSSQIRGNTAMALSVYGFAVTPDSTSTYAIQQIAPGTPQGTWVSVASEVAFAPPLLNVSPVKDRQGLFMVLVQRMGTVVSSLSGRYLGIQVQLNGDRRSTPEIAALRIYSSRFSYVNNYLPELYRENKFGSDADAPGPSTHRDFFERFVDIFEAQMTRIEDRIANSYLLTRPEATPDSSLDWLGGWIGVEPGGYPQDRRRARLMAAPSLHRKRGTVDGIIEAVNVATGGLCARGAVLAIEDFRLRHIFATILGANLSIANDPLLPGYTGSANSFVGDTLFLGDPRNPDFLALFASNVALPDQQQQVQQFLESLAYRITVFIHNQVEAVDVSLVQQIVGREKPAHVAADIRIAEQPFMIGLASLLGVNSYLAPVPPPDPVVVNSSLVGRYNLIRHIPSLDPRWENGESNVV